VRAVAALRPPVRVLTWNLYHGRSVPPAGRELSQEFARLLACWEWDLALLQEVPPWWPPLLASAARAEQRTALTSRNAGRIVRRVLAERWPDVIKSNGGGCNAILARAPIVTHHALRLRTWPERRVAQLARLDTGVVLANYHASARASLAQPELERLSASALAWAGPAPLVLGGDLNLRSPEVPGSLIRVGSRDVDHLFAHRLEPAGDAQQLARDAVLGGRRVQLSDHVPLLASLRDAA
jgi:endonuclease/exonuclease/phosphatase family metal-dependent hydrolase